MIQGQVIDFLFKELPDVWRECDIDGVGNIVWTCEHNQEHIIWSPSDDCTHKEHCDWCCIDINLMIKKYGKDKIKNDQR